MKKDISLVKEKRSIHKCTLDGNDCFYVIFTNTYKETVSSFWGKPSERTYDETLKSNIMFETQEKAEQYSETVIKCDTLGEVEFGRTPSDTTTVPAVFIYPKNHECLKEHGCFGCLNEDITSRSSAKGFTFFQFLSNDRLYCDSTNTGCLKWEEFYKLDNIVSHYISKLKMNVDFPEDEVVSFEILHVSKRQLAALQASSKEMAEARQLLCELEELNEQSERIREKLAQIPETRK